MKTEYSNLLILCAHRSLTSSDANKLKQLAETIDNWKLLIQLAQNHRITPLLYKHLHDHCPSSVPENAMEHLHHLFFTNAGRNVFLDEAMTEVLNVLECHNIKPLIFKGLALAVDAFGDTNLRQFDDIDLIIPENTILKTHRILTSKGYEHQLSLTPNQAKAYLHSQRDWVFIHKETGVILDINSTITPRYFRLPFSCDLYSHRRTISIANHEIDTPSIEHLLPALLAHGAYHQWTRLSWISDIAALLETHSDIDWSLIQEESDRMRSNRILRLGLTLAHKFLNAKIPDELKKDTKDDQAATKLSNHIRQQFLTEKTDSQSSIKKCYFHICIRGQRYA